MAINKITDLDICISELQKSLGKELTPGQIEIISEYGIKVMKDSYKSIQQSLADVFEEE